MRPGDFVMVVGSKSLPESFLGSYGVVRPYFDGTKRLVEFHGRVGTKGTLAHTANPEDLKLVGRISNEQPNDRS